MPQTVLAHPLDETYHQLPKVFIYKKRYGFRQRLREARLVLFTPWSLHLAFQIGHDHGTKIEYQRQQNGGK